MDKLFTHAYVHTQLSSLQREHKTCPSHLIFLIRHLSHALRTREWASWSVVRVRFDGEQAGV